MSSCAAAPTFRYIVAHLLNKHGSLIIAGNKGAVVKKIVAVFMLAAELFVFIPFVQISASSIQLPDASEDEQEVSKEDVRSEQDREGLRLFLLMLLIVGGIITVALIGHALAEEMGVSTGEALLATTISLLLLWLVIKGDIAVNNWPPSGCVF